MFMKKEKKMLIGPTILAGGLIAISSWGQAASAATETKINLCNKNNEKIYIAIAYEAAAGQALMSRGWWSLDENKCMDLSLPLGTDRLLIHGQSDSKIHQWVGAQELCINALDKFDYNDAETMPCNSGDNVPRGFKEVSVAALTTLAAGGTPKFDFLPAEAVNMGSVVKICNDHNDDAYISLSQKKQADEKVYVSGWYNIKPGTCYETLRVSDATDLLVFAQSSGSKLRWKGDQPLCTDDYSGFDFEDAKAMDCTGNNQRVQLFRNIPMASPGDIEFRLRSEDAHQVRSLVDICNVRSEKAYIALAWPNVDFPGQVVSTGWYNVEPGKCIDEIAVDAIQLMVRVEDADHEAWLEGDFQACVNSEESFEFGNATKMVCSGENLEIRKFDTKLIDPGKVRLELP